MLPRACLRFILSKSTNGDGRQGKSTAALGKTASELSRYATHAIASGVDPNRTDNTLAAVEASWLAQPATGRTTPARSCFQEVELFYAAVA